MTSRKWISGIVAAAAIFALAPAGCKSDDDTPPPPDPNTLTVTNVSKAQYDEGSFKAIYAVTTASTTVEQISKAMLDYVSDGTAPPAFVVAGFDMKDMKTDAAASISGVLNTGPFTLTLPLYTPAGGFKTG
ncbi:MAG: hypothetical protein FWD94_04410 [Treponema sp.]|nr:hypothetical protein [Treponema sp.]